MGIGQRVPASACPEGDCATAADVVGVERARYDVTRGRLLAAGVRYMEFIRASELASRSLDGATNRVVFLPSSELRCGSTTRLWVEDAQRLLRRCVEEHSETPWAYLAQRELDYPLGIDVPAPRCGESVGRGEPDWDRFRARA